MKPDLFVKKYLPDALATEKQTGIHHLATLAQAALESAWGDVAPGNMLFGVKDNDGINGNEQLLTTTEYHSTMTVKYPVVISITPVVRAGKKMFKYKIKDYFREYATPADCFNDHAKFFFKNPRYGAALAAKSDPVKFVEKVAAAGYATDPNYAQKLKDIIAVLKRYIK